MGPTIRDYCSKELGIKKENVTVIGFQDLLKSNENPNFAQVWKKHGIGTPHDYFLVPSEFRKKFENIPHKNNKFSDTEHMNVISGIMNGVNLSEKRVLLLVQDEEHKEFLVLSGLGKYTEDTQNLEQYDNLHVLFSNWDYANLNNGSSEIVFEEGTWIIVIHGTRFQNDLNIFKEYIANFSNIHNKLLFVVKNTELEILEASLNESDIEFETLTYADYAKRAGSSIANEEPEVSLDKFLEIENEIVAEYRTKSRVVTSVIYLLNPFNLREVDIRKKLRKLLDITENQEQSIYDKLIEAGYIIRAGDVLVFKDKRVGQKIVEDTLLNNDKYNLEGIINQLELYE